MAAKWTIVCFVCAILITVNSQTTQSMNGTQPSTSDGSGNEDSILDKSMVAFYEMVKGFLIVVQPKKIEDQGWLNLTQLVKGQVSTKVLTEWQQYANYLVGFAVCFVVGILFCIIMPIVGCCFCCCRCCNRCGGRKKVHDPKRARCKRVSYCTVLLILTTIMLAGTVCAFVTNDLIHRYLMNENNRGPVGRIDSAFGNLEKYVNQTVNDVQEKALHAFDATRNDLVRQINNTASGSVDRVANMLNANTFIREAVDLSKDVNATREDLDDVKTYLTSLQTKGQNLTQSLEDIKNRIMNLCPGGSSCPGVDTSQYNTDANFTGLSDLSAEAGEVSKSLDMTKFINEANNTVSEAKRNATKQIQDQINSATSTLDSIRGNISSKIDSFRKNIKDTTKFASDATKTINDQMTPEVKKYFDYVWYAGIGLCSLYLLIVVCYYMGVLFGLCGERPGYDAPCCNKGIGANFLMAGVGFSFLFSWLLMLFVALFFIVGGPTYTEVCRYFDKHNPQELKFVSDAFNSQYDLAKLLYNNSNVHLDIVTILEDCKENKPVYDALKLENLVNLSSIIDLTSVDNKIDDLGKHDFNLADINLVNPKLQQKIEDFGNSGLDLINFTQFDEQMKKKLTQANLTELAGQLRNAANQITNNANAKSGLLREADKLVELERILVVPMEQDVENLRTSLDSLKTHQDIQNRTKDLVHGLEQAQDTFNANSSRLVKEMVQNLTVDLKETTRTNVDQLIGDVQSNVGKCRPVYDSVYQLTDAVCKTILDPFNGLWFSWGWCLMFFIPTIIFAVKLAGLYRREEEYSEKDFDDANFSMYGGPTPDTIPLTSLPNLVSFRRKPPNSETCVDTRHGGGSGAGYPGMANSGYRGSSDDAHHGGRQGHSNGYPPYDMRSQGSKDMPPPEYGGGGHSSYPPKYDHDPPRYRDHQRPSYPMRY